MFLPRKMTTAALTGYRMADLELSSDRRNVAAVGVIPDGIQRYATDLTRLLIPANVDFLAQVYAIYSRAYSEIVALEEVAGSSPVGRPPFGRKNRY